MRHRQDIPNVDIGERVFLNHHLVDRHSCRTGDRVTGVRSALNFPTLGSIARRKIRKIYHRPSLQRIGKLTTTDDAANRKTVTKPLIKDKDKQARPLTEILRTFAITKISGRTPLSCIANHAPARPNPLCTSSTMSMIPCLSHISRRPRRNSGGAGT